jgi:CRISPR-associated protein Csy2
MMHINEITNNQDRNERDKALRKAFASYGELPITDNAEFITLVILLNLTLKRSDIDDLCNVTTAQQLLKDSNHLQHCLRTTEWFHTHNLKYPDPRVSKQRLIAKSPVQIPGIITSAGLPLLFGWANNSSDINYSKLFNSAFVYQGKSQNLAQLLVQDDPLWLQALIQLGLSTLEVTNLCASVKNSLIIHSNFPADIDDYSKQLRFPSNQSYIAITPVVSHSLQARLHQLAFHGAFNTTTIKHAHPASVSSFVGVLGGNVSALYYPPDIRRFKPQTFTQSKIKPYTQTKTIFDNSIINDQYFIKALDHIIHPDGLTKKQKQNSRHSALKYLKRCLCIWLSPIFDLRDDIENNHIKISKGDLNELTEQLITHPRHELHSLSNGLTTEIHKTFQLFHVTKKYAYHARLLHPIKQNFAGILKQLGKMEKGASKIDRSTYYLHLSNIHVYDALALANPYLCGIPSLSALAGFCHDYQRRVSKLLSKQLLFSEFAWFIRDYSPVAGKQLPEPSIIEKSNETSNVKRPGIVDNKHCDLLMDLVIKIQMPEEQSSFSDSEFLLFQSGLPSRFAGGCLHPPSLYESINWCELYSDMNDLYTKLARLPRHGCWIYPYSTEISSLDELSNLMKAKPTIKPVSIGYIGLEDPNERNNSIAKNHMYAESCIGVAQCINPIDVRLQGINKFIQNGFWQPIYEKQAILIKKAFRMGQHNETVQTSKLR